MIKYLVNRRELNGLITAARRVNEMATIVAIDVKPNTPPQNAYKSQPIHSVVWKYSSYQSKYLPRFPNGHR